jgi:hypothetical protein
LAGAYFISVTYYLQLLSAFLLNAFGVQNHLVADIITTGFLLCIGLIGMWKGLGMLEGVEKYFISLNLGMIGALIIGLVFYNLNLVKDGAWALPDMSSDIGTKDLRIILGLLIVVQGFETSRYLGDQHSASERIKTMRAAQIISSLIYLSFVGLVTVLFHDGLGSDVTAVIKLTAPVAVVLPVLLSIAAIGSQFSAAVADDAGAGGLIKEITHGKVPMRYAYVLILFATIGLTWETHVNAIIAYASRAFALYYMFQCILAAIVAWKTQGLTQRTPRITLFACLSFICFLVFMLGLPSE